MEFDTVTKTVCDAITKSGTLAMCRYPDTAKLNYHQPAVTVYIKESRSVSSGFGEYIGTRSTAEGGEVEIYGKKLEMSIGFDVFSPEGEQYGAEGCSRALSCILNAMSILPSAIKAKEITLGDTKFNSQTGMYSARGVLKCDVFVSAEQGVDGLFTDFTLRGVVIK